MKKAFSLLFALTLVFSLSTSVFAEQLDPQGSTKKTKFYRMSNDPAKNKQYLLENGIGFSVADNPQLFVADSGNWNSNEWRHVGSTPTVENSTYVKFYGVVDLYTSKSRSEDDSVVHGLDMKSNIRGQSYLIDCGGGKHCVKYSGINSLRWHITVSNSNITATVQDWAPKGTQRITDGSQVQVTVQPSLAGYSLGSVSKTFPGFADKIVGDGFSQVYTADWIKESGYVKYPDTVYLGALVTYYNPGFKDIEWGWWWQWRYTYDIN
ncbi:hypothetical protein [Paenibacillus residui]|uniref:Uncharacterized protein n=1 Tax=Paenibacillus residui TaxID=629724 RepID=A0ABW3D6A4_9BACL